MTVAQYNKHITRDSAGNVMVQFEIEVCDLDAWGRLYRSVSVDYVDIHG
jgi:hypothetical protein